LRVRNFLIVFLALFLAGSVAVEGKTGKSSNTTSSAKKRQRTVKKRSARSRGPARQTAPTPERYVQIQQALVDKGYDGCDVDGTWDSSCVQALKNFQKDQNLDPDGKIGALSLIALGLGPKREPLQQHLLGKPEPAQ
jgi:peptidoglycan hydrolase-like protein with peptidoglycan-binding domain